MADIGTPSGGTQIIQVALDRTPEASLLAEYRQRVWMILGFAIVASSLGGYVVARRGIRPVEQITQATKRIHSATLNERIPMASLPLEIEQLAGQFNEMLDRLEDSFARLSRFSNDIAHELRTPINNLRGSIEVTLSKDRVPDEYRDALGSCLEDSTRLGRIIESLLFLARSENPTTKITVETVDIAGELGAIKDYYAGIIDDTGLAIRVDAPQRLLCELDRTLFQRAVSNLLENSIAHTPQGGTICVAATEANGELRVTVSDTGIGISSEDLHHVFERFYKAQVNAPNPASSSQGLGLGLAIVKGIVTVHGGTVNIASESGHGTRVTLIFPTHPLQR
jgi:two-component system heavy metal sensor histidine kinase CusS